MSRAMISSSNVPDPTLKRYLARLFKLNKLNFDFFHVAYLFYKSWIGVKQTPANMAASVGSVPLSARSFSDGKSADQEQDANSALTELDKGDRSRNLHHNMSTHILSLHGFQHNFSCEASGVSRNIL